MNLWSDVCQSANIQVSQVLLAPRDTEERKRHINLRQTMSTLLSLGVVPIVNENDSVTTYEICFGDNDRLAARVATMMSADMLVLLSDIDGLYDRNPKQFMDARHIPYVDEIDEKILSMGGDSDTDFSSGGMKTSSLPPKWQCALGHRWSYALVRSTIPYEKYLRALSLHYFKRLLRQKRVGKSGLQGLCLQVVGCSLIMAHFRRYAVVNPCFM